jgi:hypothetical protein
VSERLTEEHHDSTIFFEEIVVLVVLGGTGVGRILWLVLPTEVPLHEVAILHGVLDRTLVVGTMCLKHLLKVIPRGTSLRLGRSLVGRRHQVVVVELALFLLLLQSDGWSLALFLLGLLLAESDHFLPVGMVDGHVKELSDGLWLDSPYPVDKGLTCGTILEGCDDLVVCHVGELGAAPGEAAYVLMETLTPSSVGNGEARRR